MLMQHIHPALRPAIFQAAGNDTLHVAPDGTFLSLVGRTPQEADRVATLALAHGCEVHRSSPQHLSVHAP